MEEGLPNHIRLLANEKHTSGVFGGLSGEAGFPGDASGKEPSCQCRRHKRCGFDPWVGKSPGEGNGNRL